MTGPHQVAISKYYILSVIYITLKIASLFKCIYFFVNDGSYICRYTGYNAVFAYA